MSTIIEKLKLLRRSLKILWLHSLQNNDGATLPKRLTREMCNQYIWNEKRGKSDLNLCNGCESIASNGNDFGTTLCLYEYTGVAKEIADHLKLKI